MNMALIPFGQQGGRGCGRALSTSPLILASDNIGMVSCVVEVEPIVMSFTIALITPHHDLIFCGEGKELALWLGETEINQDTTEHVRDDFLKTLALNEHVCISLGGKSQSIRAFLKKLLPKLLWEDCKPKEAPTNFADAHSIKSGKNLLDLSVEECCAAIVEILNGNDSGWAKSAIIALGGVGANGPALYSFHMHDGEHRAVLHEVVAYGSPCDFMPTQECPTIDDLVESVITLKSLHTIPAEQLCLEVVELVADHSYSCNKNITFRRLSKGFVKEGREIIGN